MDLNQLLANHQIAVFNQRNAKTMADRTTYFDLVGYYAERIRKYRLEAGVPSHLWREPLPAKTGTGGQQ